MIHEWKYQGKPFQPTDELLESYQGFVYCLMNLKNGKNISVKNSSGQLVDFLHLKARKEKESHE
jgi:hypothetical protein